MFHAQKKNNFDNLPPPKALRVNHRTNHVGADITRNGHRVVHHPLKPPLQSSLTHQNRTSSQKNRAGLENIMVGLMFA
jgi:hypothetical protein